MLWKHITRTIPYYSLMIDDGKYAMAIVGYKIGINNSKHIIIADPHIRSNKTNKMIGIY